MEIENKTEGQKKYVRRRECESHVVLRGSVNPFRSYVPFLAADSNGISDGYKTEATIEIFFSSSFWIHGMFYMICICYIHTNGNIISILSYILIHSCERRNMYKNKKDQLLKLINKQLTRNAYCLYKKDYGLWIWTYQLSLLIINQLIWLN